MFKNDVMNDEHADSIFEKYVIPILDEEDENKVYLTFEPIKKGIIKETLKSLNVSFKIEEDEENEDGDLISIFSLNIEDVKESCPLLYDLVKNPSIFE